MTKIPYNLEINNSRDHDMLCELLAKAREDYEVKKENIIIDLLNSLSTEVAELKATLKSIIKENQNSPAEDTLICMANVDSPIEYTESMCSEMEGAYIDRILYKSGTPSSARKKIRAEYHSLRNFVNASASDFAKIEGVSACSATNLRLYINKKFDYPREVLFTPEIVRGMKEVFLNHILCGIGLHACRRGLLPRYPTLDDLSTATKTDLLQIRDIGYAKVNKLCEELEMWYGITIRD